MVPSFSEALMTDDGVVTAMGKRPDGDSRNRGDSFALTVNIPLRPCERSLMALLLRRDAPGEVRFIVRSSLAQLGLDAFDPLVTDVSMKCDRAVVETLVTNWSCDERSRILDALRTVVREGRAKFARAALLPDGAALEQGEIEQALDACALRAPGAAPMAGDLLAIPLQQDSYYQFDYTRLSHDQLVSMLLGQGRAVLSQARSLKQGLPDTLAPHGFFVGAIDVATPTYHVVIEGRTLRRGETAPVIHGHSSVLDRGRTGTEGLVQVELRNVNGTPESLSELSMCARVYRATGA